MKQSSFTNGNVTVTDNISPITKKPYLVVEVSTTDYIHIVTDKDMITLTKPEYAQFNMVMMLMKLVS